MREAGDKKRGCLFYGCLTFGVCAVLGIVGGYFAVRYAMRTTQAMVNEYTDASPAAVPAVRLTAAQQADLQERLGAFRSALNTATYPAELVLSTDELNAMLAARGGGSTNNPAIFVKIQGDQLQGNLSIPLWDVGPLKLAGRYMNGLATLTAQLTNQMLEVRIQQLSVKGKSLPEPILAELRKRNLAQEVQSDPQSAQWISKFESVEIRDGAVHLRNRIKR
jgi:hypothetical protein